MHDDDNQIHVPPSFTELYTDSRGRLQATAGQVRNSYELCEDLACALVEQAQTLYHQQTPSESETLRRIHAGLRSPDAGLTPQQARWVVLRLSELLGWVCPELPTPAPDV